MNNEVDPILVGEVEDIEVGTVEDFEHEDINFAIFQYIVSTAVSRK